MGDYSQCTKVYVKSNLDGLSSYIFCDKRKVSTP